MSALFLEGSLKTSYVNFDPESGLLELKGRSIPENSIDFYKPLIDWLDKYGRSPQPKTALHVQLEYFNTSSSKCILDLFKKLEGVRATGNEVTVLCALQLVPQALPDRYRKLAGSRIHHQREGLRP